MKLSQSIRTRIANASVTVQRLVYDALADAPPVEWKTTGKDIRAIQGTGDEGRGMGRPELEQVSEFIYGRLPGMSPGRPPSGSVYDPCADAVAYAIATLAGRMPIEITRFFDVEHDYVRIKLRRLLEHAVKR